MSARVVWSKRRQRSDPAPIFRGHGEITFEGNDHLGLVLDQVADPRKGKEEGRSVQDDSTRLLNTVLFPLYRRASGMSRLSSLTSFSAFG